MLMQTYITRMNIYLYLIADDPAVFCSFIQLLKQNRLFSTCFRRIITPIRKCSPFFHLKHCRFCFY